MKCIKKLEDDSIGWMSIFHVDGSLYDITNKYHIKTELLDWLATMRRAIGMDEEY